MYRHGASRNAQPSAPVALDSSNQFIDGLVFSWVASDCITDEQFTQTLTSLESGVTRLPTADGNGIFVATSAASSGINFPVLPFIGIDKYTIAVDSAPAASATRSHFYFYGTEAGSPFPQYALCANTSRTGAGSSGKFALIEYDSTFKVQAESIAGMVDGQRHLFEAVRDGTTVRLFRDGIDVTGTLGTISGTHSTTTGNANIGGSVGASNRGGNYPIYMVQAWNLARTPMESAEYARNYWKTQQKAARYFYPAASGQVDYSLTCAVGAYTYTGQSATLSVAHSLTCSAGSYSYAGVPATLTVEHNLACATGAYAYSGISAALSVKRSLSCASGSYAYSGVSATLSVKHGLSCDAGSYTYAGVATTLTYIPGDGTVDYVLTCGAGAYAYTGQSVTLSVNHSLTCAAGAYAYSGVSASLQVTHGLTCDTGAYTYAGSNAILSVKRSLACATGSYDYIGNTATLDYLSGAASINYVLTCAAGAYTYGGQSATLTVVSSWAGEPFNFSSPITRAFGFTSSITKTLAFDSPI